ncbi:MAG TPA: GNAT family N-acetyltransferase [Mycobacteriales bacterium]|nr:GNAT family N-acetyltransferase [Mycobacteriales bacterium]
MGIELDTPRVDELDRAVSALRDWQYEGAAMQLHPGDLGWFWRFGAETAAGAVRIWSRNGRIVAVGLLDGRDLLRLTTAPDARRDSELAQQLAADVADPARGILPEGRANVEAPMDALLQDVLAERGWMPAEPWTPLSRDLADPVPEPGKRIEAIGPDRAQEWAGVVRASFDRSTFSLERWQAMAAGPAYADARCLAAFDDQDRLVAAVTVWSAGAGRPGLLEPMGVHRDHRGHGYGRAITVAAAAALRALGSSSALVCTPSSNVAAVATYRSAGYEQRPAVRDLYRAG